MGTMLVRYLHADRASWGKLVGAAPRSGKDSLAVEPLKSSVSTTRELISLLDTDALEFEATLTLGASQLLSPITSDSTLVCQGLNYSEHAAEAQQHTRRSNLIFAKASSSLTGHGNFCKSSCRRMPRGSQRTPNHDVRYNTA